MEGQHETMRPISPFENSVGAAGKTITRSQSGSFVPRPAIAFDLDETLVFSTLLKPVNHECFSVKVRKRRMFVQMRPGLLQFLARIQRRYDVFFFTSSAPEYANPIIDKIAPSVLACRRFFRDSCYSQSGYLVKDLSLLRRSLNQIILVDDTPGSALAAPGNLIRVRPWSGEPTDDLLMRLLPMLESLAYETDLVNSMQVKIAASPDLDLSLFPVYSG
jgi:Dullard-like phosphatase family protein